jgi:hypothetical protein
MDTGNIAAILSLVGVIVLGVVELVKSRGSNKLDLTTAEKINQDKLMALVDKAMELNKQEFDTMKQVNEELRRQVEDLRRTVEAQILEIARLENRNIDLETELNKCKVKLGIK